MAGDWIKMRVNLDTDPRILSLACILGKEELHVVGMLWKIWSWADGHSLDGNALSVTSVTLDRFVNCPGFADALRNVGWLEGRDSALTFPRFAEHNGQTAKQRALTAKRVDKSRSAKCNAASVTQSLPEKRREEKRRKEKNEIPPLPPSLEFDDFKTAWGEYVAYRREKKLDPLKPRSMALQWDEMATWGKADAIEAIRTTIRNGWQGIFPPKKNNGPGAQPKPLRQIDILRAQAANGEHL